MSACPIVCLSIHQYLHEPIFLNLVIKGSTTLTNSLTSSDYLTPEPEKFKVIYYPATLIIDIFKGSNNYDKIFATVRFQSMDGNASQLAFSALIDLWKRIGFPVISNHSIFNF